MQLSDLDVLIVDDHEAMRAMLRAVFTRAGAAHVRDAASGAEALALIAERAPSLILADRRMPEMDGLTLISRVRATLGPDTCRIIMISGQGDTEAREAAHAAGADALLVKPVSPRDLLAAIEALYV